MDFPSIKWLLIKWQALDDTEEIVTKEEVTKTSDLAGPGTKNLRYLTKISR